ncbi:hypothetical protein, partial [Mesorhizobium sp.]|uniref:hypothetical protein n=1 Tax=Mesorhizobium sp. TaxID=1871066 RepID=UPI0025808D57
EKWTPLRDSLSGETGQFYSGTFGENSSGIDRTDRIKLIFWDGTGVASMPSVWRMGSSAGRKCMTA